MSLCIWNSDKIFGRKETLVDNLTVWGKDTIRGGLMSRAASSLMCHANVIATKNKAFHDSSQMSQVAACSNWWRVRQRRTRGKFQSSAWHFIGGYRWSKPFRNHLAKGWEKDEKLSSWTWYAEMAGRYIHLEVCGNPLTLREKRKSKIDERSAETVGPLDGMSHGQNRH